MPRFVMPRFAMPRFAMPRFVIPRFAIRSHFPLLLGALAAASLATPAAADTRTVDGQQLVLTSTLSSRIEISSDASLSGRIRLEADNTLSCLSVVSGTTTVIATSRCDGDDLGTLHIVTPTNQPITISSSGEGEIRIGDTQAPLIVTLSNDGNLRAGRVGSLVLAVRGGGDAAFGTVSGPFSLDLTGSGDVRLAAALGPVDLKRRGSGDLVIGRVEAPVFAVDSAGSGDTLVGGGHVQHLDVRMAGSGDLAMAAEVGGGSVETNGGGDVKLGTVTGQLERSSNGGSTINVGGPAIVTDILSRVARAAGEADVSTSHNSRGMVIHASSVHWHMLTVALVAVMLFLAWRMIRRSGGLRAWNRPKAADGPLHPGVVAVCDTMTRLEQRLGRLESYVTTREFDLNRKFRDLGRS